MTQVRSEVWLPVAGHPDYEVSNFGRVRSLPRESVVHRRSRTYARKLAGKVLALHRHSNGYVSVRLAPDDKTEMVNRLVCRAFKGPAPDPADEADHINEIRNDNRDCNLQWLSVALNREKRNHARGSRHGGAKLTEAAVSEIRQRLQAPPATSVTKRDEALAAEFGVSRRAIGFIRLQQSWRHVNVAAAN